MKAIVIIFCFLFSVANAQRSMLNGWANPTSPQAAAGDEIFRMVDAGTCADGWQYLDPDDATWKCMTEYDDPNDTGFPDGVADLESAGTYEGYIFKNSGTTHNSGRCVTVAVDGITIRNCIVGSGDAIGVFASPGVNDFTFTNNLVHDVAIGMYISNTDGNVLINNNWGFNFQWDWNNPVADQSTFRNGQFIFFNSINGTGNEVNDNKIENNFGRAFNEDAINTYASQNIEVTGNKIRGGIGSMTGGGIIGGDNGSLNVLIDNNDLIDPGWYGIQIHASGSLSDNIDVTNNNVYSGTSYPWNSVGFLIYPTASGICTNVTMSTDNAGYYLRRPDVGGANYPFEYYSADGTCTGGTFSVSSPGSGLLATMAFPSHLIDCLTIDDYWKVWDLHHRAQAVIDSHDDCSGCSDVNAREPTANAGTDQSIAISTATLSASGSAIATGGNGTFTLSGYTWTQVSGPNTATMSAATSSTNNLSGLITGTYIFRLVVQQNNNQFNLKTYDADWITVAVGL